MTRSGWLLSRSRSVSIATTAPLPAGAIVSAGAVAAAGGRRGDAATVVGDEEPAGAGARTRASARAGVWRSLSGRGSRDRGRRRAYAAIPTTITDASTFRPLRM